MNIYLEDKEIISISSLFDEREYVFVQNGKSALVIGKYMYFYARSEKLRLLYIAWGKKISYHLSL